MFNSTKVNLCISIQLGCLWFTGYSNPYQSEHRVLLELLSLKIRFYSYQFPDINTLEQCEQNRCVLVKILRSLKTLYGHRFRSKNMG